MSRWSVWQIGRGGAPERVGTYTSGADARRVLRSAIPRGAAVDPDGEVSEARGVSPAHVTAIEAAAEAWLATAEAPTMPAPPEVIEIPEPEGPLPVAFEPPVVEPPVRSYAERVEDLRAEIARGRPSADLEHLRAMLADETASRALAEQQRDTALATVALRQSDCDARDIRIADLDAALRECSAQLDAARARIRAQDEELAVAAARLARRDHTVADLRAQLADAAETPIQTIQRRLSERAR